MYTFMNRFFSTTGYEEMKNIAFGRNKELNKIKKYILKIRLD